jgi:selenocysteine-specific elongation factor
VRSPVAEARPLTLGTAGHVDHGKTVLVRALTGVDCDRLPEEKERGLTIELGYAPLALPGGRGLSLVDVPGHGRFVRTMVAGATGIDCFLMVVAADDGVMPQTIEHARVLQALDIGHGVVAVTKSDVADPARAAEQARALVPGAEVVAVSAREGHGLDDLLAALERMAAALPGRPERADGEPRLHVDRSFTIRGAGTVVTGTLWSGSVGRGDHVSLVGRDGSWRVRSVQVHDASVERATAGQRVALNLVGMGRDDVRRGDVVAGAQTALAPTRAMLAELAPDDPGLDGERVQLHHGTRETPARLRRHDDGLATLSLEQPLLAAAGDRFVVRRIAPPATLGGGVVVDAHPRRREPRDAPVSVAVPAPPPALDAEALALEERLRAAGHEPPGEAELAGLEDQLAALRGAGRVVRVGPRLHFHAEALARVEAEVRAHLEQHGDITLAALRDRLGTSRRFAQALLEHFDGEGLTLRRGDTHVLRRRRAVGSR